MLYICNKITLILTLFELLMFVMANGSASQTAGGNLQCAKLSDMCGWVKWSWEQISDEIIIDSFKNCHILNTLDNLDISDNYDPENSDKENDSDDNTSVDDIE